MAGHSKFKNIMHRKDAQDKKKAKLFTRAVKEIIVAARSGVPDPESNPRLRAAINTAKQINLPKDKIDKAISKSTIQSETTQYQEVLYEGYGPGGLVLIVQAFTDNKNRTTSEIRAAFNKNCGVLGEPGSVRYMFNKISYIVYRNQDVNTEDIINASIDMGVEDVIIKSQDIEILSDASKCFGIYEALAEKFGQPYTSEILWVPNTSIKLSGDKYEKASKLLEALDSLYDTQCIYSNLEKLSIK